MAGLLGRFFGKTASEGAAYAFGVATGPVLAPATERIRQEAWQQYPDRALSHGEAAGIVAEDVEAMPWGIAESELYGVGEERFRALVGEALNAPGVPELLIAWRRGLIDEATFTHGLRKAKLEPRWDAPLKALRDVLLTPSELANARQQGFVTPARQRDEAERQGVDNERAEIQYELSGLPPGPATMQEAVNRGLTDRATFDQAIREGHTKTKYTELLWSLKRRILSPVDYINGRLRGWITDAEMYAGTAQHGLDRADTDLMFRTHGRPISFRQVFIGRRRGGTYDGPTGEIDDAFLASLRQSDIRPEWYHLAWSQRYTYPSAFVLRALTSTGELSAQETEQVLLFEGWEPGFARKVAERWAAVDVTGSKALTRAELLAEFEGGFISEAQFRSALATLGYTGAQQTLEVELGNARRVKSFRDAIIANARDLYVNSEADEPATRATLGDADVPGDAQSRFLELWTIEREMQRRQLTPAQIAKAYKKALMDRPSALDRLEALGYNADDAATLLDEA